MLQVSSPRASPALGRAMQSLSTALPEEGVVGREAQKKVIREFLAKAWKRKGKKRRALYVSGAPGTGKTACLKHLLRETDLEKEVRVVFVNCMGLSSSREIFARVAQELDPAYDGATPKQYVEAVICSSRGGRNILLVLDEVDQLDSREQEVLYSVFEWPQLKGSRLSLVGIANALDLTDRILPRLKVRRVNFIHYRYVSFSFIFPIAFGICESAAAVVPRVHEAGDRGHPDRAPEGLQPRRGRRPSGPEAWRREVPGGQDRGGVGRRAQGPGRLQARH